MSSADFTLEAKTVEQPSLILRVSQRIQHMQRWKLSVPFFIAIGLLLYFEREPLWRLLNEPQELQQLIDRLGWWGPAALVILTVAQIIVAPIPGYGVYLAAGWLYGFWWGGVWGSIGLLLGGMSAMYIGRRFGRPLVIRMIGAGTLARWERLTHSDSSLVWFGILLSPIGDAPFMLAGLASVRFRKILLLAIITRVPAAFAAAALGAGAMHLTWWQLLLIIVLLAIPYAILARYQEQISARLRRMIARLTRL